MGSDKVDWRRHEKEVANELGLRQTVSSGNQWYEKGDATTADHPMDSELQFDADMKCTSKKSFSLDVEFMNANRRRSQLNGKIFLLPVRFQYGKEYEHQCDYITLGLGDFEYLLGLDAVKQYRERAERSDREKGELVGKLTPLLESLNTLAMDVNLTPPQKNLLFTTVDSIYEAVEEM